MNSQNLLGFSMILVGLALAVGGVIVLSQARAPEPPAPAGVFEPPPPAGPIRAASSSEEKGRKFEEWVAKKFDRTRFELKDWRGDKHVGGVYPESSRYPDLEIGMKGRQASFAVECKWRRSFVQGWKHVGIDWATDKQIENYQRFQHERNMPVFVAIGVGGEPDRPAELYVAPLDQMKYPFMFAESLAKFRRPNLEGAFRYDDARIELR